VYPASSFATRGLSLAGILRKVADATKNADLRRCLEASPNSPMFVKLYFDFCELTSKKYNLFRIVIIVLFAGICYQRRVRSQSAKHSAARFRPIGY
jgi:hypothetical protein